jgi:hypothetical protein
MRPPSIEAFINETTRCFGAPPASVVLRRGETEMQFVDLVAIKRYATVPALTITVAPLPALTAQGRSRGRGA